MFVKKGDTVVVLTGRKKPNEEGRKGDRGRTGKVLSTNPKDNKVIVEGINESLRHKKPRSAQDTGGKVEFFQPLDASNVQVVCPSCDKPTRVGITMVGDKKVRVCKKCGKPLDGGSAKAEKKSVKKAVKKAEEKKTEDKKLAEEQKELLEEAKEITTEEAVESSSE